MLLEPRSLTCTASAELDTDAIRNRDSGMIDRTRRNSHLRYNMLTRVNREAAGILVSCVIQSKMNPADHRKQVQLFNMCCALQMTSSLG